MQPGDHDAKAGLANALLELDQPREAERIFRELVRAAPDDPDNHNELGLALQQLGQTDQAIESFRRAASIQRDFADPHANLASAYEDLGDRRAAVAEYEAYLRLSDDPGGKREVERRLKKLKRGGRR